MAKKKFDNYGVEMNGLQSMRFQKYINELPYGMNTISKEQRTELAQNWLNNQ